MTIMYFILLVLSLLYSLFLCWCWMGWRKLKNYSSTEVRGDTLVSIIIPVRNEEDTIEKCLEDLAKQNYPIDLFEIIIVNDHSTDKTNDKVVSFIKLNQYKVLIRLLDMGFIQKKGYKKEAISEAVKLASGKLIITTDADCRREENWLNVIVSYYETNQPNMLCGPVSYYYNNSPLQQIQSLEFCGLVAISAGSIKMNKPMLCNGANLAFTKEIFQKVNGYSSLTNVQSGDDTLLMKKIDNLSDGGVHFLMSPQAIVYTRPVTSLRDLFNQRKRWASKIPVNMGLFTILVAAMIWAFHSALIAEFIFCLILKAPWSYFLIPLAIKMSGEFLLLERATHFFGKRAQLWLLLPSELLYCLYVVTIGTLAPLAPYNWKGRAIK